MASILVGMKNMKDKLAGREIALTDAAVEKLRRFEAQLDPARPEAGPYAPRIIGYGEMSTVFSFDDVDLKGLAFKRMAVFRSESEILPYEENFKQYSRLLNDIGVFTPDYGVLRLNRHHHPVLYIFQRMVDPLRIGPAYLRATDRESALDLFQRVLLGFDRVFSYNAAHNDLSLGFDGQMSNWAWQDGRLFYLDTSTPLMRRDGVEQLDPELFLRICPSYLVWVIRLFFLKDVLNRYYDLRLVIIDLIANLYKEKKIDLIDSFIGAANGFLRERYADLKPIRRKEVDAYYKEDAWIWRIFLAFRKLERFVKTKIQRTEYELILPEKVER